MKGFVFINNKNKISSSPDEMKEHVINNLKGIKHEFKIISNNNMSLIYYTNEADDFSSLTNNNIIACPIGQFVTDKNQLIQNMLYLDDVEKRKLISELQGTFLLAFGNLNENRIDVFTHVTRIESAYFFESKDCIVIGSDPIIVSAMSNDKLVPEFQPSNFVSFFELGYFADEKTPYKDVRCLPENSHIIIENNYLSIYNIDDSYSNIFKEDINEDYITDLTDVFLKSLNIVPRDTKLTLGLTGGKDSRLIFTSLLKQGFDLDAFTFGFAESPDVVIAKEMAKYYGIQHTTKSPTVNDSQSIEIDLIKRLTDSMKATSGQIYAYENIHPLSDYKQKITVNGVAGEVLRGGYIIPPSYSTKTDKKHIINKFYRYSDLYIEPSNDYYHHLLDIKNNDDDYLISLYKQYLKYKCGRWSSDSRNGKGYLAENYMPFLDNQLVKLVMKAKPHNHYSGKLQFDLLKNIDDKSVKFRFETSRFNFEKSVPLENDFKEWYQRRPLYPTSKIGKYNWRLLSNNQEPLINTFREILISDSNNKIYDIVDKRKIERIFNSEIEYKHGRFIWALASMSTFINYVENNTRKNIDNKIKLEIPSDEIKELTPKMKLISLTDQFESLNSSLEISVSNKNGARNIQVVDAQRNPYIKTFSGKFNELPLKDDKASIKHSKAIRVNVTLGAVNQKLELYLILYSNKKRIQSFKFSPKIIGNEIVFDEKIDLNNDVEFYRLALKFPKSESSILFKLNYSFAEIFNS